MWAASRVYSKAQTPESKTSWQDAAVDRFVHEYPNKNVINTGSEVIVEHGSKDGGASSDATVAFKKIPAHYHEKTTETYVLREGAAVVCTQRAGDSKFFDETASKCVTLGDALRRLDIPPKTIHYGYSVAGVAVLDVKSVPPFDPEDSFPVTATSSATQPSSPVRVA